MYEKSLDTMTHYMINYFDKQYSDIEYAIIIDLEEQLKYAYDLIKIHEERVYE